MPPRTKFSFSWKKPITWSPGWHVYYRQLFLPVAFRYDSLPETRMCNHLFQHNAHDRKTMPLSELQSFAAKMKHVEIISFTLYKDWIFQSTVIWNYIWRFHKYLEVKYSRLPLGDFVPSVFKYPYENWWISGTFVKSFLMAYGQG